MTVWHRKILRAAPLVAGGLMVLTFLKGCGSGNGSTTAVAPSPTPTDSRAAIEGRVLDPFTLCTAGTTTGAGTCLALAELAFPEGSSATLYSLNSNGDVQEPALESTTVDGSSRFRFETPANLNPPGQMARVANTSGDRLHGFVFSAVVEVSVWSEALYQIVLQQQGNVPFTNLTGAELRDLENILRTQVPLSSSAQTLQQLIDQAISDAERLEFDQLRFIEDLIEVCYAPEGNQTDQPCRRTIPIPVPDPPQRQLPITNTAYVVVGGSRIQSNTVTLTVRP